ncbi:MAG TPA: type VI secretion system contractile sheath large subunit [Bryobacteraceae bacterium]|jgi:type VI secretion system protein ImpC|nr:type VI secretion system contractile sheath large subunit [Bryobacteraceae bacterium]
MARIAGSTFSEVHLGEQDEAEPVELDPERPFRVLLAGDFSGRSWRENPAAPFKPVRVDRDNFDDVLASLGVSLNIHGVTLNFREFEDFHPDAILQTPLFQNIDRMLAAKAPPPAAATARAPSSGSLLDQLLDEQEPVADAPVNVSDAEDLAGFIKRATKGHLEPRPDPTREQRTAQRLALTSELLQGILHHPRMQAIEAAWRALYMLIRGLDTDTDLHVYLLDITLPELVSEMSAVQKELRRKGPWALIAGNYTFAQTELDAQVLRRLAALGSSLGAPFLAEAQLPREGVDQAWTDLRHSPDAAWIGLALPRFLLRLPYGKATEAIEGFPFEEMPQSEHGSYLWGNPAFLCAYLLGKSYLQQGWGMTRIERRLDNLPMHVYREDGEPVAKPCAEVLMTEKEAETLLEAGFMPVASIKEQPAAMVVRFQSIAEPLAPLAGLR